MSHHANEPEQKEKDKSKPEAKHVQKQEPKQLKQLEERVKALENQLAGAEKQIEEHKVKASQYLNTASYYKNEAENCKKDLERFKERNKNIENDAKLKANETVAQKILPIIDNFDQAISHVDASVMKGFSMIYQSLLNVLSDLGLQEIHCSGEVLNGEYHNCISTEPTDDEKLDGKVASVYQKGYMFADTKKVVRPATVSVYKKQNQ